LNLNTLRPYARTAIGRYRRLRNLQKDRRTYVENKRRHWELYQPDARQSHDPELLNSIIEDGVVVVREFLPRDVVERIAGELRATMEAIADDRYEGPLRTRRDDKDGVYRLFGAEETLSPSSRIFFHNSFIAAAANSLTTTGMHTADSYVDYKAKIGGHDPSVNYHIDHWKLRFKAFLLLQDVSENGAPLVYVAGSHKEERWRRRWDWGYQRRGDVGGVLRPRQADRISRQYGYEERVLMGRAGDLILANTHGIHHGTELQRGTRLQLVNLFAMNGPPEYAD
jgi:hypothetical protein